MISGLEGIRNITDIDLKEKRVFIRVDFNVPMQDGMIADDHRIRQALPTIRHAMKENAKIIIASHMGRPKSAEDRKEFSLEPVATRLSNLLDCEVMLMEDPAGQAPKGLFPGLKSSQIIMLENIRFDEGEEKNSHELAAALSNYTDVYINDAFGASHRAHASIVGLPTLVKEKGIGFLMRREIEMLDRLLYKPDAPFTVILGGSKVSDKIGLIENLMEKIDTFIVGGAMAYTFLAAKGVAIGSSRVESNRIAFARELLDRVEARNKRILLPVDHIIVESLKENAPHKTTDGQTIPDGWMGVDIGPKSVHLFEQEMAKAKTIFWNGPMGVFEMHPFEKGTFSLAETLASMSATSIVGGGDTASAVKAAGLAEKMSHVSTGGGASLEYLQGDRLPGLEVLREKKKV